MLHATARLVRHRFGFRDSCVSIDEEMPTVGAQDRRALHHGRLPTVFLVHGRFGQREIWTPLTDRLKGRYRFVNIELPGFGESFVAGGKLFTLSDYVDLVTQLVRRFGSPGPAILMGHDLGGAIAQLCATVTESLVDGLVLVNTLCLNDELSSPQAEPFGLRTRWNLRKLFVAAPRLGEEVRRTISEPWLRRRSRAAMLGAIRGIHSTWPRSEQREDWRDTLCGLWCPTLILWGAHDPMNSREKGAELLRNLPNASLFVNEACGHWPCLEDSAWTSGKLRDFVAHVQLERELTRARRSPSR